MKIISARSRGLVWQNIPSVENTMFRLRGDMGVRRGWQGEKIAPTGFCECFAKGTDHLSFPQ